MVLTERARAILSIAKTITDLHAASKPEPLNQVWTVSSAELSAWAENADKCIDLLPDTVAENSKYYPVVGLVLTTAMILMPRIAAEKEIRSASQATASDSTGRSAPRSSPSPAPNGPANPFPFSRLA